MVESINQNALMSDQSYQKLEYLCKQTAGRLPGTPQSLKAIDFIKQTLIKYGADSVWLFPVMSPGWMEIKKPVCEAVVDSNHKISLNSVSLGQCISTSGNGVEAQIVIINSKSQIDSLGESGLKGKIVFFNQKMKVRTDYGLSVWQRSLGASMVARYGAVGVLVRSLTTKPDNNPHTGIVHYDENFPKIPAIALSWQAADSLENLMMENPDLKVHIETFCSNPGLIKSNNVIAEIRGSKYPDQIMLLTAHLDTWHNTQGAHDNSGGISQIIDVIRVFNELNIKPKHTIRVMAYMDEEQSLSGMKQYAEGLKESKQTHVLDIEVDYGIGTPTGFDIQADSTDFAKQVKWKKLLTKYNLNNIKFTGNYATSWPLYAKDSTILGYLVCKDDHYFDYHHSANDVFEAVEKHNLQSGSAALAAFIYILDKMEVIDNSKRK
jgi:hypothetical protein